MKVFVYPFDNNPYQRLLYGAMKQVKGENLRIKYGYFLPYIGALHLPFELFLRRIMGYKIVHIHWIAFYMRLSVPKKKTVSWYLTRFNVCWIKLLGYKVVWTVHDVIPHEPETKDDVAISQMLANKADLKIVHSKLTIDQMVARKLNTANIKVIKHGNYDKYYPDNITRMDARRKLRIKQDETVILFFGMIRPYKGIDDLLIAFKKVRKPTTKLIIVGHCDDSALKSMINEAARDAKIIFKNGYVSDVDVVTYFKACDLVCLPFKSITTSGSTLLALTFGKPIVAPKTGALLDLPDGVGNLYDPIQTNALVSALEKAVNNKDTLNKQAVIARKYAKTLAWDKIANQTYDAYTALLEKINV